MAVRTTIEQVARLGRTYHVRLLINRMAAYADGLGILRGANIAKQQGESNAETTPLRQSGHYQYELNLADISEVWRRGSVSPRGC